MTKVLARTPCCLWRPADLQSLYGKENLLDDVHRARPAGGFHAAHLVGPGLDDSHPLRLMVGRLPQRLVLIHGAGQTVEDVHNIMVKLV
jgi:hypothetical protein